MEVPENMSVLIADRRVGGDRRKSSLKRDVINAVSLVVSAAILTLCILIVLAAILLEPHEVIELRRCIFGV